jgi:uncharacterized membrane protein
LPSGYTSSYCYEINESVQAVGMSQNTVLERAYLWKSISDMVDLGSFNNTYSRAYGINEFGVVTGFSHIDGPDGRHATIWDEINGLRDLNDLIISGPTYEFIADANDINDVGQIVALSFIDKSEGIYHGVLLTPIAFVISPKAVTKVIEKNSYH